MSRIPQPQGRRGSLKWLQIAVNDSPACLSETVRLRGKVTWLSPLRSDDYAEYRDAAFLQRIGCSYLETELADFWPKRGPQWDALGRTDRDEVVLVEAKAHIPELFSPKSGASLESLARINLALSRTVEFLNAAPLLPWGACFYQVSNRLAHLMFLHNRGVEAHLVFVNFLNDRDMQGPETKREWEAAYRVADHVLGLSSAHRLARYISHVYVDVRELAS